MLRVFLCSGFGGCSTLLFRRGGDGAVSKKHDIFQLNVCPAIAYETKNN